MVELEWKGNKMKLLLLLIELLKLIKDSDGDGRPDLFDDYPNDPEKK